MFLELFIFQGLIYKIKIKKKYIILWSNLMQTMKIQKQIYTQAVFIFAFEINFLCTQLTFFLIL